LHGDLFSARKMGQKEAGEERRKEEGLK